MLAIITIHCSGTITTIGFNSKLGIALVTPFKFATIGFFLISGFLLGERVDRRNPVEYFMRRFRRVFVPWLFWYGMMCTTVVAIQELTGGNYVNRGIIWTACSLARAILINSSFWFVPNLLLGIATLLICRRYLYSLKLGIALLAVNLVYVVNIYTLWFRSGHGEALFGFVFYLWLGSYAAQNFERISHSLARIPTATLVATSLIAGIAAYWESNLLSTFGRSDPLNTLRLSNQVFSISMVLLIFKFDGSTWPRFIDVRRHTFGLYLSHSIVLLFLMSFLQRWTVPVSGSIYVRAGEVNSAVDRNFGGDVCLLPDGNHVAGKPAHPAMDGRARV